ncbi:hypothetical protein E3U43_005591 [Larimichthys crocea]|uniref:Uncharacterized protein n=1 Tax=Larimichthys crocea TaxID=215358 RepID=A0ACD3QNN2_LARCR|nr:hypothetical protein E3U43_005591 [Larimichthys crocea]
MLRRWGAPLSCAVPVGGSAGGHTAGRLRVCLRCENINTEHRPTLPPGSMLHSGSVIQLNNRDCRAAGRREWKASLEMDCSVFPRSLDLLVKGRGAALAPFSRLIQILRTEQDRMMMFTERRSIWWAAPPDSGCITTKPTNDDSASCVSMVTELPQSRGGGDSEVLLLLLLVEVVEDLKSEAPSRAGEDWLTDGSERRDEVEGCSVSAAAPKPAEARRIRTVSSSPASCRVENMLDDGNMDARGSHSGPG